LPVTQAADCRLRRIACARRRRGDRDAQPPALRPRRRSPGRGLAQL